MSARRADRKRVLVFSASYGGSHGGVADALARYLKTHHATETDVHVVDFLERFMPSVNVLAKFGYQQSLRFFPSGCATLEEVAAREPDNPVMNELSEGGLARVRDMLGELEPHAVISVLPVAAAVASEVAAERGFLTAAVLTDFSAKDAWLHPATDAHFVAAKEVGEELVVGGVKWGRVTVSGLPVPGLAAQSNRVAQRKAFGLADRFTILLVGHAGSGSEVASIAAQLARSGIQVAVSLGDSPRLSRQVTSASKASRFVHTFGKEHGLSALVGVADVIVSRPGGSIAPVGLSLSVPFILYNPVPGQERSNVDFLVNYGVALLARDEDDATEKARFLSTHPERLEQMVAATRTLGRVDAAGTVCERVLAALDRERV